MKTIRLAVVIALCSTFCLSQPSTDLSKSDSSKSFCKTIDSQSDKTTCSFTGLNNKCDLYLDRIQPITPLAIYLKPGAHFTLHVINATPLEKLSFDITTSAAVPKPDVFQTIANGFNSNIQKISVISTHGGFLRENMKGIKSDKDLIITLTATAERLLQKQTDLIDEVDGGVVLEQVKLALQPMTPDSCKVQPSFPSNEYPNPWFETAKWKSQVRDRLEIAIKGAAIPKHKLTERYDGIDKDIHSALDQLRTLPSGDDKDPAINSQLQEVRNLYEILVSRQKLIPEQIKVRPDPNEPIRLELLKDAITALPDSIKKEDVIFRVDAKEASSLFNLTETRTLAYANLLAPAAAQAAAKDVETPLQALADAPPAKTQIVQVPLQIQGKQWVEMSTGILVPFRKYHSYKTAAVASGGAVTDNVVQETDTYTVIPSVLVNVNMYEWPFAKGPVAVFLTGALGVNPLSTTAEYGLGGSISWKSIQLNVLADYGSDVFLKGGFTVGQSFGTGGNPPSPLTKSGYGWRGAAGISIRIPIGGGGSK